MMSMDEKQETDRKSNKIDIQHPESPDTMTNLHILDATNVNVKVEGMRTDMGNIRLEEKIYLMENEDTKVTDTLEMEQVEKMMYEQEVHWDMEKATEWDDQYTIHLEEP